MQSCINTYNQKKSHLLLWPITTEAEKSAHHMQPALSAGKRLQQATIGLALPLIG